MKVVEDAFNTNTKVFSDGMQMLEAQNEVLRRVAQDLYDQLTGGARDDATTVVRTTESGEVAFNAYLKAYIQELADAEARAAAGKAEKKHVVAPGEDSPIIFGGDGT